MAPNSLLFSAVSSSTRQIHLLLRCISFAKKAQVRISADGLRFSTEEGSAMEAFVFLEQSLFTSYSFRTPSPSSPSSPASPNDPADAGVFEINLASLLETLNIFGLSKPGALRRPGGGGGSEYDAFTAHRLHRHAGAHAFAQPTLGVTGVCTFAHDGVGTPLSVHLAEAGVTTTCDLTTYDPAPAAAEEIPFARDRLALKAILRAAALLDAVAELSTLNPTELTVAAAPAGEGSGGSGARLALSATGALGSVNVDFSAKTASDTPVLETFHCPAPIRASFKFGLVKAAQRAMAAATKVSVRLDEEGVLSLQFLVEVDAASAGAGGDGVAFVDFRIVPLLDGEEGDDESGRDDEDD